MAVSGVLLMMAAGCQSPSYCWALREVQVSLPRMNSYDRPRERAGTPAELLHVEQGGNKTMLVVSMIQDDPVRTDDESAQTFVFVMDGPPLETTYVVSPENCRLIRNAAFKPARRPYEPVEGEVTIELVEPGLIRAHCVFRNILRDARGDSYVLRGTFDFVEPRGSTITMRAAGIAYGDGNE
jgi:hypothetical protein